MIILDDSTTKGETLEWMSALLLKDLGYVNIRTNEIGPGGHEIDVTADYAQPALGGPSSIPYICECKATSSLVDTTQWLKFIGKLFTRRLSKPSTGGCMIALTGVNGNVAGAARDLANYGLPIQLLEGDQLEALIVKTFRLASADSLQVVLNSYSVPFAQIEVICSGRQFHWLVRLTGNGYSILKGDGTPLRREQAETLIEKLEASSELRGFTDLGHESDVGRAQLAIRTAFLSRAAALGKVSCSGEQTSALRTGDRADMTQLASHAVEALPIFRLAGDELSVRAVGEWSAHETADLLEYLFEAGVFPVPLYGTEAWRRCTAIDVVQVLMQRIGFHSPSEKVCSEISRIIAISPSALIWLIPQQAGPLSITAKDESGANAIEVQPFLEASALRKCLEILRQDILRPELMPSLHKAGLREIELEQRFTVKGPDGAIFEKTTSHRTFIGLTGNPNQPCVAVDLLPHVPQPWEPPFCQPKEQDLNGEAGRTVIPVSKAPNLEG